MSDTASTHPLEALSDGLSRLVAGAAAPVVSIQSRRSRSSGFVWKPGLIVTAAEALAEDGPFTVILPGGDRLAATLAGRDPTTDIALLRIERQDAAAAAAAGGASVAAGTLAVVIGAKDGIAAAALGMVSLTDGRWRSMRGGTIDARIELDIALPSVAEGGLVVDAAGRTLGMAVFGPRRRVLVIPSTTIDMIAARLEAKGRIARGYVGLGLQPVSLPAGGVGAIVLSVDPGGPGATSGLWQGDVIVAWNGQPIAGIRAMLRMLGPDSVGTQIALSLMRAGERVEVALTVGERPDRE